jgi:hypothetical protein
VTSAEKLVLTTVERIATRCAFDSQVVAGQKARRKLGTDTNMAEGDFWFFLGAVSLSAGVIGWVCFLEISYRLERRRRRAGSIGLARLKTATETVVLPLPAAGVRSREQLPLLVRTAVPKRKLSIRLPMWPLSKHVKQPSGHNSTAVYS